MSNTKNSNHDSKRDPAIELARLFGCLIVIECHTYLSIKINNQYDKSRLFIGLLFADGVTVFWLICGAVSGGRFQPFRVRLNQPQLSQTTSTNTSTSEHPCGAISLL